MIKEHPILFSTAMVQALLAGRKTQTRRIMKPQPEIYEVDGKEMFRWNTKKVFSQGEVSRINDLFSLTAPYGQVGDILWVRETAQLVGDGEDSYWTHRASEDGRLWEGTEGWTWRPSIHMPKAACRIWLEITDIRVERVGEISEEDAVAEGIQELFSSLNTDPEVEWAYGEKMYKNYMWPEDPQGLFDPKLSFESLWESINGPESWEANPFVWALTFKVLSATGKPTIAESITNQ